jgi:hypothetical protein
MQEKENILRILSGTKQAIKEGKYAEIKDLSNQTTNTASLAQDPDNIAVAVIVYSLSKILQRENYSQLPGWANFYKIYLSAIDKAILAIQKNDEKALSQNLELITSSIEKLSGKLKLYIQDVFRKSRINKASRIHEHGISKEKTAKLLGISLYELASYAGQKNIVEAPISRIPDVKTRIKLAMDMFQ